MTRLVNYDCMDCDGGVQHHFEFEGEECHRRLRESEEWCRETFGSPYVLNKRWWRAGSLMIIMNSEDAFHFKMRWG